MPSLTAAILDYKLGLNEEWLARRREIAKYYHDNINDTYTMPFTQEGSCHIYHKFVIRLKDRDNLKSFLSQNNVQTMVHYSTPLHRQPCFVSGGYDDSNYRNAIAFSNEVVSLPIHPFLENNEFQYVVETINAFGKK
jgi:dTDP-4-amino-4,6-dideoxygalactose transaminase